MSQATLIALVGVLVTVSLQGSIFAFFLGRLAQRVAELEKDCAGEASLSDKVIRLEVQMGYAIEKLESLDRGSQTLSRQIANLAGGRAARANLQP